MSGPISPFHPHARVCETPWNFCLSVLRASTNWCAELSIGIIRKPLDQWCNIECRRRVAVSCFNIKLSQPAGGALPSPWMKCGQSNWIKTNIPMINTFQKFWRIKNNNAKQVPYNKAHYNQENADASNSPGVPNCYTLNSNAYSSPTEILLHNLPRLLFSSVLFNK